MKLHVSSWQLIIPLNNKSCCEISLLFRGTINRSTQGRMHAKYCQWLVFIYQGHEELNKLYIDMQNEQHRRISSLSNWRHSLGARTGEVQLVYSGHNCPYSASISTHNWHSDVSQPFMFAIEVLAQKQLFLRRYIHPMQFHAPVTNRWIHQCARCCTWLFLSRRSVLCCFNMSHGFPICTSKVEINIGTQRALS